MKHQIAQAKDVGRAVALDKLLRPRSIVMYGASEKSTWSRNIFTATKDLGFAGPMYAVNRSGASAHGLPAFTSATQIPEPVDAAYVLVPVDSVEQVFHDMAAAGIRSAVVLTSGFSEAGADGTELERRLSSTARKLGISFLGPNSMGFANIVERRALCAFPLPDNLRSGNLAIVSQSGSTCVSIADFALERRVGLSFMVAVGNEAALDVCDLIEHLVEDEATRAICIYAETMRNPQRFVRAARLALARRKPLVVLKVGKGERSAAIAQAHTGALVGDDKVFDAMCRQNGIVRVNSIEELVITAALLAHTGPIKKSGVAYVSISGGSCSIFSDAAEQQELPMPAFAKCTAEKLRALMPGQTSTLNPFDVTGAVVNDPSIFAKCLETISDDPAIGLTVCGYNVPGDEKRLAPRLPLVNGVGSALRKLGSKGVLGSSTMRPITEAASQAMERAGIACALGGIEHVARAVSSALAWSAKMKEGVSPTPTEASQARQGARPNGEREVLDHLRSCGVPVIPATLVTSAAQAVEAARTMGLPVVLKVSAPDIAHKTEVGGVKLDLRSEGDIEHAFEEIQRNVRARAPGARVEGLVVSPMRQRAIELFVSVTRDPQWGPVLALGLGGIWIEVLKDVQMCPLPATETDIHTLLRSLRGYALLQGSRGSTPADLDALVAVVLRIADAALALADDAVVLEINPLRVLGREIEALDGLVTWQSSTPS